MARERLSMRKAKEILRLTTKGLSRRTVARATGLSTGAVSAYVARAKAAGLDWEAAKELDEAEIEARLFPALKDPPELRPSGRTIPDWDVVHAELRRKHVTLQLLWEEYREVYPKGYGRSQFFERYRRWQSKLPVWMRQTHRGGEKLFVDFSGDGIPWVDPRSGERREARLFVAALGASQMLFARATHHERLWDWLEGIEHAFEYYGGVTKMIVPDQPRSVAKNSSRFDPEIQQNFADFATHYSSCVIPARPRKPRDKAKVESAVLIVQRWIIARLRHSVFSSVEEINVAVRELIEAANDRIIRRIGISRRDFYEKVDRPALGPLPARRFEHAEWKFGVLVGLDYHVEFEAHHYSVPYRLARERVDIRATKNTVEIFCSHRRVASHARSDGPGATTNEEHMPSSHRRHADRSQPDLLRRAQSIGTATRELVEAILTDRPHPEQGYRACLGLLSLARRYPNERLEAACLRALVSKILRYQGVESILKIQLENEPLPEALIETQSELLAGHKNLRGSSYYN